AARLERELGWLGDRAARSRALLVALAWACGPGLPSAVWVTVARALAPGGGAAADPPVTNADVRRLLRRAPGLVVRAAGPGGRPAYRLWDEGAAALLRGDDGAARGGRTAQVQAAITQALVSTVPLGAGGPDWSAAHPYVRAHLVEHAAAAGSAVLGGL